MKIGAMITTRPTVRFHRRTTTPNDAAYVAAALRAPSLAGDGEYIDRCEVMLREILAGPRVLLTTSCSHALEIAALLLELEPGDEVIMPSFNFPSTANAVVRCGGIPRFIDIRPDTMNLDEGLLERAITDRTKAIVPVHYAGIACEMDAILSIAKDHGIAVVEDSAHGLFGSYRGQALGTFGIMSAQSFDDAKNLTSGEGGALVINDERYINRAEVLRECGTDRRAFLRGTVESYSWQDVGSKYLPSNIHAALLAAQLEDRQRIQLDRQRIWDSYNDLLKDWAESESVSLPFVPHYCSPAYHLYYVVLASSKVRDAFVDHLSERGVTAVGHYSPLHNSPYGRKLDPGCHCPVTEDLSCRLVRLPLYTDMTIGELDAVVEAVTDFSCSRAVAHFSMPAGR